MARGFQALEFPNPHEDNGKKYIDLWPIQMSAEIETEGENKPNVLTTNFDTYTLILQLGCILNTVPDWKKAYKLRVAVFVEYESDVEEERGRVQSLLENLRIDAKILVFWLASGDLKTYEIIVNGASPSPESENEVEECLRGEDWWEELQIMRGKRAGLPPSATEDLAEVDGLFSNVEWPESSFQQGPRTERVERFLGLRKLLKKPRRRHTMSGLTKLGVSLGMRTHRLAPFLINRHVSTDSASEDSDSISDSDSDSETFEDDEEEESMRESAASEGDLDDYETDSDHEQPPVSPTRIMRRRSEGDSLRGPPPSKKATGEREPKVPEVSSRKPSTTHSITSTAASVSPRLDPQNYESTMQSQQGQSSKPASISDIKTSLLSQGFGTASSRPASLTGYQPKDSVGSKPPSISDIPSSASLLKSPLLIASDKPRDSRPSLSRHASQPKFSSKPVPLTKVATEEDAPGPSIMFTDTPSPPSERRKSRLPSAYRSAKHSSDASSHGHALPDHISEVSEGNVSPMTEFKGSSSFGRKGSHALPSPYPSAHPEPSSGFPFPSSSAHPIEDNNNHHHTTLLHHSPDGDDSSASPAGNHRTSRRSSFYSTYSTSHLPLSFNDLPCRAQHLILNELLRSQSQATAVLFTTLPSPAEGTSKDEGECLKYLSDLDVLGRGCPPVLMVHSNSEFV